MPGRDTSVYLEMRRGSWLGQCDGSAHRDACSQIGSKRRDEILRSCSLASTCVHAPFLARVIQHNKKGVCFDTPSNPAARTELLYKMCIPHRAPQTAEARKHNGAEVTGGLTPPDVDAGNQTQPVRKSYKLSHTLCFLSSCFSVSVLPAGL